MNLVDAVIKEMIRVREEIIPIYATIPSGTPALMMMQESLDFAEQALAGDDPVALMKAYKDLSGYNV